MNLQQRESSTHKDSRKTCISILSILSSFTARCRKTEFCKVGHQVKFDLKKCKAILLLILQGQAKMQFINLWVFPKYFYILKVFVLQLYYSSLTRINSQLKPRHCYHKLVQFFCAFLCSVIWLYSVNCKPTVNYYTILACHGHLLSHL